MHDKVQNDILSGRNNSRLDKGRAIHKEDTAAWSETEDVLKPSNVSIPSQDSVIDAKEWVDNGSKL